MTLVQLACATMKSVTTVMRPLLPKPCSAVLMGMILKSTCGWAGRVGGTKQHALDGNTR